MRCKLQKKDMHQLSLLTSYGDFHCAIEWKWKPAHYSPEACLATKTAKIVSRSNDYQKLIDLMTFCEALNRLASVASICAHSHHEGPQAFSYEWHPCSSLISWAQPHIIEICRLFFFLSFFFFKRHVPLLKAVLSKWAMSQTLGCRKKSFMGGFPAELSWLKGNEEVGRRDTGSWGDVWGLRWGCFEGAVEGGGSGGGLPFWSF